jgi:hypothetical protein
METETSKSVITGPSICVLMLTVTAKDRRKRSPSPVKISDDNEISGGYVTRPIDERTETLRGKPKTSMCHHLWTLGVGTLFTILLAGCGTPPKRNQVPEPYSATAEIAGIPEARFWGDERPAWLDQRLTWTAEEIRQDAPGIYGRPHNYLAISGGGSNGAFGAGLLNGWTAAGTRPEFTLVTGISTGALIAPFAFLGPKYDTVLEEIYTNYSTADLLELRSPIELLNSDSFADTAPLRAKIAQYVTESVMQEIAAERRKGRALFIGTANLDLARPVIWDIGAIADSGQPGALNLIRDIMLASASIPGAFPPVYIKVEAGGEVYDEMHVDGGTATQVFLYPLGVDWREVLRKYAVPGRPHVYVIRNSRLAPEWTKMEPQFVPVVGRSVDSLIRTQGIGDMYRMYLGARRDNLDYHLALIPEDFDVVSKEVFDPEYMKALYKRGYDLARDGYPWARTPPGYTGPE